MTDIFRSVEETPLLGLGDLDVEDVYAHVDDLVDKRPGPLELFKRWESQQWSAGDLDFSVDAAQWTGFDRRTREDLESIFAGFFVGEQWVTDTLGPLVTAAPDEESRIFLSTQLADEARHSYFFSRFYQEVLGRTSLRDSLEYARPWAYSEAYRQVFDVELTGAIDAVRLDPTDYSKWVEGLTVYHLMIEGILALTGQRLVLEVLRAFDILPSLRAGFVAVTRDESRHVSYGVWALARAVTDGLEPSIRSSVDRCLEPCLRVYSNPEYRIYIPEGLPPERRRDPRKSWSFAMESLTKRLRVTGLDEQYVESVAKTGWDIIWAAVDEYEQRHGEEHPVRFHMRTDP